MAERNKDAGHQHLFIGPWDHEGTADRCRRVGLLPIRTNTGEAKWDTFVQFFDRYLKGLENGFGANGAVRYYVMGKDIWRNANSWPPKETGTTRLYLRSAGHANTLEGDGHLTTDTPAGDEVCRQL